MIETGVKNSGRIGHEKSSPGHETTREMRILMQRFPGILDDDRVVGVFRSEDTGKVQVLDLRDNRYDPQAYFLGGNIDYEIEAIVLPIEPPKGAHFRAGEIREI